MRFSITLGVYNIMLKDRMGMVIFSVSEWGRGCGRFSISRCVCASIIMLKGKSGSDYIFK